MHAGERAAVIAGHRRRTRSAPHCDAGHLAEASALLAATGKVIEAPRSFQDAVTAISGSGPAYIFYVVEAMIEAGVVLGMPRTMATELAAGQTLYGAATMIRETGQHPTVLREQVTSPGGTTAAARCASFDDHKVRAAFISAMEAAAIRSRELLRWLTRPTGPRHTTSSR